MGRTTATILFTDLVGSTELRGRLGEEPAERSRPVWWRGGSDGGRRPSRSRVRTGRRSQLICAYRPLSSVFPSPRGWAAGMFRW
jgi:hypothetical protein